MMPYVNDEWIPMAETFGIGSTHQITNAEYADPRLSGLRSVKNYKGGVVKPCAPTIQNRIGFHSPPPHIEG